MFPAASVDVVGTLDRVEVELPADVTRELTTTVPRVFHGSVDDGLLTALALALVHWLRGPRGRWLRIPAALLCFTFAFFWFMPVIGLEWAPVGFLLIAIDVPFLQRPSGLFILWLLEQWQRWKAWRAKRRAAAG